MMSSVKARLAKVKSFSNSNLSALETAINAWLAASLEVELLQLTYFSTDDGATTEYSALLVYTEA